MASGLSSISEHERFELLATIGDVADGTMPLGQTVERLLGSLVPAFSDVALLDALGEDGELRRLGARVADGDIERERALLRRRHTPDLPVGVLEAIASGRSHLLSPVTEEHLRAIAGTDADLGVLRSLGMRSAVFVPLRARGRPIGALSCAVGSSGRSYTEGDLRFARVLSGRIALALDNAGLSEAVSGLERRLEATLANLAEAVVVRDVGGRMVFANLAAATLLGVGGVEELKATSSEEMMRRFDAFDETGRPLGLNDLPSARAQLGERPEPLLVRNVVRATGDERWLLHKATPVFDRGGELTMVVNVIEDLTEVKRAELAQRLLAEAGSALSSSLDYEQTLQRVAQLAVPRLADWCGVRMRGGGDVLEQVAVAHVDPTKVALALEYGERNPARLSEGRGIADVLRTGRALVVKQITEDMLEQPDVTDEQRELIRALQMRSVIIVPLAVAAGPPIGAMTLVMAESGRTFTDEDVLLAEELGRRAGVAVEHARMYTERSRIAATLQRSLLPPALPDIPGFKLATLYRAAGEHNQVGGDFYDAFEVPGGWMVVVGDVAGRGAEAAALTSLSRYTLRSVGKLLGDPIAGLGQLNEALRELPDLSLVTVCCALVREHGAGAQADVVLAGHPPPYHVHDGAPVPVGVLAACLGAYEEGAWTTATVDLAPGDQLVLYTDGVFDAIGESERFGEERLADTLVGATSAADAVARIERALSGFARGQQADDTAILAVERIRN